MPAVIGIIDVSRTRNVDLVADSTYAKRQQNLW